MSRGEDGPPDRHANSDSLQSAEADLAAVGTASKAEGVGGYEPNCHNWESYRPDSFKGRF